MKKRSPWRKNFNFRCTDSETLGVKHSPRVCGMERYGPLLYRTLQNRFYDPPPREIAVKPTCAGQTPSARKRQRYQSTRCAQSRAASAEGRWHLHLQSTDATEPYEVSVWFSATESDVSSSATRGDGSCFTAGGGDFSFHAVYPSIPDASEKLIVLKKRNPCRKMRKFLCTDSETPVANVVRGV